MFQAYEDVKSGGTFKSQSLARGDLVIRAAPLEGIDVGIKNSSQF